jgi:hypothetical protein
VLPSLKNNMARLIPYTFLSATRFIDGTDCLGDTRPVLNTNFQNLETTLAGAVITTNRVSTSTPPLSTYTRTLSVYNSTGQYLGFIPIYQ